MVCKLYRKLLILHDTQSLDSASLTTAGSFGPHCCYCGKSRIPENACMEIPQNFPLSYSIFPFGIVPPLSVHFPSIPQAIPPVVLAIPSSIPPSNYPIIPVGSDTDCKVAVSHLNIILNIFNCKYL